MFSSDKRGANISVAVEHLIIDTAIPNYASVPVPKSTEQHFTFVPTQYEPNVPYRLRLTISRLGNDNLVMISDVLSKLIVGCGKQEISFDNTATGFHTLSLDNLSGTAHLTLVAKGDSSMPSFWLKVEQIFDDPSPPHILIQWNNLTLSPWMAAGAGFLLLLLGFSAYQIISRRKRAHQVKKAASIALVEQESVKKEEEFVDTESCCSQKALEGKALILSAPDHTTKYTCN